MSFACPTCKSDRWLEVHETASGEYTCYCRKCEEGCVPPLIIKEDEDVPTTRD
jgi:hypothetical protein